jgi:hypothetical protein
MVLLETKTGSVKDGITELYEQSKILKIKKRKINLTLSIEM